MSKSMTQSDDPRFTIIEDHPEFRRGMKTLGNFLSYFLTYPDSAKDNGISGEVHVKFFIEPDGTTSNIQTIKGLGYGCDEAAEYAISRLPDWKPGYQRGKPVRVQKVIPISFQ